MARGAISDEVLRQAPAARENALHWNVTGTFWTVV